MQEITGADMENKTRIILCSLIVAVPVYFLLARDPNLSPETLYPVAAAVGFVAGIVLNALWKRLMPKEDEE